MKVSIGNYKKKGDRKVKIHIDKWDTWSMDHTLAMIALPMLEQLKETNHGSATVDLEDVPEELRYTTYNDWDSQKRFDFYNEDDKECMLHERWNWVMDEMIFAFEFIVDEDNRYSHEFDQEVEDRVANGLKLFGKYYRGLWD